MTTPTHRREFLKRTASIAGGTLIAPTLAGLAACNDTPTELRPLANGVTPRRVALKGQGGYGAVAPVSGDPLGLVHLPDGFRYTVISAQDPNPATGAPIANAFDGMAAFDMGNGRVRLVRNHENRESATSARAIPLSMTNVYDAKAAGGTTTLEVSFDANGIPQLENEWVSLSGTTVNCAGGLTPWGSWLTCEETTVGTTQGYQREHGYVFEVPASANGPVTPVPIPAMGRFVHESACVDPSTGIVYLMEDRRLRNANGIAGVGSGVYRFIPNDRRALAAGGRLQALAVRGQRTGQRLDLAGLPPEIDPDRNYITVVGQRPLKPLPCAWVDIEDPDPRARNAANELLVERDPSLVFKEGIAKGAAIFDRVEGCWWGDGSVYFVVTNGGEAGGGGDPGLGQVWQYRPNGASDGWLTLIYEGNDPSKMEAPDNICVSPRGGLVLCEDGDDEQWLRGLTRDGRIFDLALNTATNRAGTAAHNGEWAGACFSPDGKYLFANIFGSSSGNPLSPGYRFSWTIAIWGPWEDGAL